MVFNRIFKRGKIEEPQSTAPETATEMPSPLTQNDLIHSMWKMYNLSGNTLAKLLGRTNNLVGEYGEYLACSYLGGEILPPSSKSADIKGPDGKLYQVKTRKVSSGNPQLGIIRSWDFDYLIIVLFKQDGELDKAYQVPVSLAKEQAVFNEHQNGWVITLNSNFAHLEGVIDVTAGLSLGPIMTDIEDASAPVFSEPSQPAVKLSELQPESLLQKTDQWEKLTKKQSSLSKSDALALLGDKSPAISNVNSTFSSPNKATGNWWLEPSIDKFQRDLYFMLYDDKNSKLHIFCIPGNSIDVRSKLYLREDIGRVSINIPYTESVSFSCSHSGFSFNKYYLGTVPIIVA